eukprot:CAMPEP_0114976890 /NCGR_PEP_ID=MMETSP0216-20121206/2927_1 /TAXON_ID=223996 /ORGANISM="Protocruzia adherens, Strain Boccale" /LENGTH=152 /DNA_ID=CAMNT_0002337875 /DNA_START=117 /DNA_END=575 /DNA_ORIENTATION=-
MSERYFTFKREKVKIGYLHGSPKTSALLLEIEPLLAASKKKLDTLKEDHPFFILKKVDAQEQQANPLYDSFHRQFNKDILSYLGDTSRKDRRGYFTLTAEEKNTLEQKKAKKYLEKRNKTLVTLTNRIKIIREKQKRRVEEHDGLKTPEVEV